MKTDYSQAGQTEFVRRILGDDHKGFFVDLGCGNEQFSNTLGLEESGWYGIMLDINPNAAKGRKGRFICADATTVKLPLPVYVDYLSLDVDENSLKALQQIDLKQTQFGIVTQEHDAWRFGDALRPHMRKIMLDAGYVLIASDVCGAVGAPFEDWFTSQELAPKAARFKSSNMLYSDILKL
jgi:hypothetical protein